MSLLNRMRTLFAPKPKQSIRDATLVEPAPPLSEEDLAACLQELGRRDVWPNPAYDRLRREGASIAPALVALLDHEDDEVVLDAIELIYDNLCYDALDRLGACFHLYRAAGRDRLTERSRSVLMQFQRYVDYSPSDRWLTLDRNRPREHIAELWTDIIQRKHPVVSAKELRLFCLEAIEAMPEISFASKADEAKTWGMLGSLHFKAIKPDWPGGFDGTEPCPESKRCYEEANRCAPDDWWQQWAERF